MQEASGLIQDSSGNGNHANAVNGTPVYQQASPILGEPADKAILLERSESAYFSVPDHATLDVGDVFSFECWVKLTSTGNIFTFATKLGGSWGVYISATGFVRIYRSGSGTAIVESSVAITDTTTWHYVACTKNGATSKVYIDGADVSVAGANDTLTDSSSAMQIGTDTGGGTYTDATLDEVAVYATVLSAARVLVHYEVGIAPTESAVYQSDRLRKLGRRIT
jgi:hypothetical protein